MSAMNRIILLNERIEAIAEARAQRAWTAAIHKLGNTTQADLAARDAYEEERRELRLAYGLPVSY